MTPAPPGIIASFTIKPPNGRIGSMSKIVIAFDDDGEPLVTSSQGLVRARTYGEFELIKDSASRYRALIPADGWRIKLDNGADMPLIGWAVCLDGNVTPLVHIGCGHVVGYRELQSENHLIYHPDELPHVQRRWAAAEAAAQ